MSKVDQFSSYDLCGNDPRALSCIEVSLLKALANRLPDSPVIVNIGAGHGVSTLALLEERPKATIYSVDVDPCEGEFENVRKAGLDARRVKRVLGESQKIDALIYAPVDLLFIDGDHQYEGVKADIENWTRVVKKGGIIAFHDYIEEPIPAHVLSRVYYAVNEWLEEMKAPYIMIGRVHRIIAFQVSDGKNS